jgi:hypothetical protein
MSRGTNDHSSGSCDPGRPVNPSLTRRAPHRPHRGEPEPRRRYVSPATRPRVGELRIALRGLTGGDVMASLSTPRTRPSARGQPVPDRVGSENGKGLPPTPTPPSVIGDGQGQHDRGRLPRKGVGLTAWRRADRDGAKRLGRWTVAASTNVQLPRRRASESVGAPGPARSTLEETCATRSGRPG